MYIDELYVEEIREEVTKLLKNVGVKHGLKKQDLKPECEDDIKVYKVFQTSLGLLEKERVALAFSDYLVDVPVFVIDACQFIRKDLTIEGLFRKAGSAAKQRELKILLDSGNRLDLNDDLTIINVANTLKMFFRELPEPLIPHKFHNLFLRCLNCKGNHVQAVLWACLLLPLSHLHTLIYLMQFLSEVCQHSSVNKMDDTNLSIIFTPTLMPVNSRKLTAEGGAMINQRMKIIQILLKNSTKIGLVPEGVGERLGLYTSNSFSSADDLDSSLVQRKRRKKRSSSLNRVISGIKKMISKPSPDEVDSNRVPATIPTSHTPKILSSAKVKNIGSNFSSRKKMTVLRSLPNSALLASTPQKVKYSSTSMLTPRTIVTRPDVPVVRHNSSAERKRKISDSDDGVSVYSEKFMNECEFPDMGYNCDDNSSNEEFVSIRKDELQEIKNRVSLLESKFQNELEMISLNDRICGSQHGLNGGSYENTENELMTVDEVFGKTVQEAQKIAQDHPCHEYEIRKPQRPIRSPSARKIGSFRNKRRVSRHSSLNLCDRPARSRFQDDVFSSKRLRRGRPNTVLSGLPVPAHPLHASDSNLSVSGLEPVSQPQSVLLATTCDRPHLQSKGDKWPTNRILRDDPSQCRRSSIHQIRTCNAGMVLQKAKLFGDVSQRSGEPAGNRRTACVHTPSPRKPLSPRRPMLSNNSAQVRGLRTYRANVASLTNT